MTAKTALPAPQELADGLLAGFTDSNPDLATAISRPGVLAVCRTLAHLQWTPLMLERWASHPRWVDVSPQEAMERLQGLGRPPEAPRSALPVRQDQCPEHPDDEFRAGSCTRCEAERTLGPPAEFQAIRRGETSPAKPSTARCDRTELLVDQCSHCLGHKDVEAIDYTQVTVHHTMNARLDGRCALDGKHQIVEGDRIGRTDDGWACTSCVDRAGAR